MYEPHYLDLRPLQGKMKQFGLWGDLKNLALMDWDKGLDVIQDSVNSAAKYVSPIFGLDMNMEGDEAIKEVIDISLMDWGKGLDKIEDAFIGQAAIDLKNLALMDWDKGLDVIQDAVVGAAKYINPFQDTLDDEDQKNFDDTETPNSFDDNMKQFDDSMKQFGLWDAITGAFHPAGQITPGFEPAIDPEPEPDNLPTGPGPGYGYSGLYKDPFYDPEFLVARAQRQRDKGYELDPEQRGWLEGAPVENPIYTGSGIESEYTGIFKNPFDDPEFLKARS